MSEKFAFSSMLHLVWAVILILGMGFVHFYMSMIATSFDPCPDDTIDSNLKQSIDKSVKYFNDIKNAAINNGTYINDAEIASIVSNSVGTTQKTLGVYSDGSLITDFDVVKPDSYLLKEEA